SAGCSWHPPGAGAPTPFLRKGVDMRDVAGFSSPFRRRAERRANARVAREGDGFIYTERSESRWYFVAVSTSFFEPRNTGTRWCSCVGGTSRMRERPVVAAPPACSTMKLIGLASY